MKRYELFIVGAGAAGMSAAIAACEAGCRSILVADRSSAPGGVLPQCIHHGFGLSTFGEELTGPEYAKRVSEKFSETHAESLLQASVISVSKDKTALISGKEGLIKIGFDKMILAAGCREVSIGSLAVSGTRPAGVFTAGQAQEIINLRHQSIGKDILILGSGDLGLIMARRLTLEGKNVIAVIEKENHYGGMARNYHRCIEAYGIPLICSATVTEIFGIDRITGVTVRYLTTGEEKHISCDTLVTALGMEPEQELIRDLGQPEWLRKCGNCSRIHDIVDSAVAEARVVGGRIFKDS